ncbi:MAG: hypothetical protein IVW57_01770 [Ktedonobacterales bacterium]|nr:hypothetical protein [Ktedonobacterales bacterium]
MGALPVWLAGIVGGIIAGGVMGATITILAPYRGFGGFDLPARLTAASVQGADALDGEASSVVLGGVLHFLLSILYGVLFAFLVYAFGLTQHDVYTRAGLLLGAGGLYGGLIFGLNDLALLPVVNRWMVKQLPFIDFSAVHILFGALLGWAMLIFL